MLLALMYLILVAVAEILIVKVSPHWGVLLDCCLLVLLLIQGSTAVKVKKRRFLLVMSLVPLIRILSTTLPLRGRPLLEWHVVIGGLLFIAIVLATRAVQLDASRIGIHFKGWPLQIGLGILGIPLGYIEYLILRPQPLINSLDVLSVLDASFILLVFTGVLEEVIFRGLMQEVTIELMGFLGLFYCSAIFTVLHIGYESVADLLFVFGVALLFAIIAAKSHSLIGVSLAHGLINISLYVIFPFASLGYLNIPWIKPSPLSEKVGQSSTLSLQFQIDFSILISPSVSMINTSNYAFLTSILANPNTIPISIPAKSCSWTAQHALSRLLAISGLKDLRETIPPDFIYHIRDYPDQSCQPDNLNGPLHEKDRSARPVLLSS